MGRFGKKLAGIKMNRIWKPQSLKEKCAVLVMLMCGIINALQF